MFSRSPPKAFGSQRTVRRMETEGGCIQLIGGIGSNTPSEEKPNAGLSSSRIQACLMLCTTMRIRPRDGAYEVSKASIGSNGRAVLSLITAAYTALEDYNKPLNPVCFSAWIVVLASIFVQLKL